MLENNIKRLIRILEESKVEELEISTFWGKQKIRIRKNVPSTSRRNVELIENAKTLSPEAVSEIANTPETEHDSIIETTPAVDDIISTQNTNTVNIKSPLVGTYYQSPKPGANPFLNEGDIIEQGQIICIIEAMKIFNEIESEIAGKVVKMLIADGTPVEYDQDLIVVSPT